MSDSLYAPRAFGKMTSISLFIPTRSFHINIICRQRRITTAYWFFIALHFSVSVFGRSHGLQAVLTQYLCCGPAESCLFRTNLMRNSSTNKKILSIASLVQIKQFNHHDSAKNISIRSKLRPTYSWFLVQPLTKFSGRCNYTYEFSAELE